LRFLLLNLRLKLRLIFNAFKMILHQPYRLDMLPIRSSLPFHVEDISDVVDFYKGNRELFFELLVHADRLL
jgi:hypothetical protein